MRQRVVILAYPGVELLDVAGPANVLTAASRLLRGRGGYDVEIAASRAGPVETAGGIGLVAKRGCGSLRPPIHTLVVPGGTDALGAGRGLLPVIGRLASGVSRVVGVCTGAFLLAEAGILDGRRAVSHWMGCAALREGYPRVRVEEDAIFVRDGRVWTSAGVTAGMDLALALVEEDHGAALALEVARWLVMYLRRPGGQSQFSAPLTAQRAALGPIEATTAWASRNLAKDLSVEALARRASMSGRNYARVFKAQVGIGPATWVRTTRLEAARSMLELSSRSVKEIAIACGFSSLEALDHAFQRAMRTTPVAYRARFALNQRS